MSKVEITSQLSMEELLSGVEQLNEKDLETFISKVLALRTKKASANLTEIESQLSKQIGKRLSPAKQKRYETLIQKRWDETLTKKEHQELIKITETIEEMDAQRDEAIFTLSQIKGVSAEALIKELKLSEKKSA